MTLYKWKTKFGGLAVSGVKLKRLVADSWWPQIAGRCCSRFPTPCKSGSDQKMYPINLLMAFS
jgi:hypothetical protein